MNLTDEQFQQAMRFCRTIGARDARECVQHWLPAYLGSAQSPSGLARKVLAELSDGRLEIPAPLSGEWAGDTTLRDLLVGIADELRVSTDSLQLDADEFGNEYEDAYRCAWETACQKILWATIQAAVQS